MYNEKTFVGPFSVVFAEFKYLVIFVRSEICPVIAV